jgi:hypothetical protein
MTVQLPGGAFEIRDNLPLREGSVELDPGTTLQDFLRELNCRVFLWPGNNEGPIKVGRLHFQHYRGVERVCLIRTRLQSLIESNPSAEFAVTFCNSGSARHQRGHRVPRGPSTFVPLEQAPRRASQVKELTFVGHVDLPPGTEWSTRMEGPWERL